MTSPCTRCGHHIEKDFLDEAGRCIGCRREYRAVKEYAKMTLINRSQIAARVQQVKARAAKRTKGRFA